MSRRPRKTTRGPPARMISLRASVEPAYDTEKLMSNSKEKSEDLEADTAHTHHHSRPKLSQTSQATPHHDYSVHEITNVPAPIPDTGLPPPSADTTTLITPPVSASHTSVTSKASSSRPHAASKSTFVPLPSLKTQNLTEIEEAAAHSSLVFHPTPSIRPVAATTASSDSHDHSAQLNTSHLSTTAIIALAISGGLTLFIVIVLVKLFQRPRRRRTPTPSLPILHDGTFPDDKVESEGSPIFGGKEHSSPTLQARGAKGNTGLWTWTQYNSGIPKPAPTMTVTRSSSQDQLLTVNQTTQQDSLGVIDNGKTYVQGQNQGHYPFVGYGNSNTLLKTKSPIPLQPVQNAITRAVSRLSTVSMSLYPNSPGGYSQVGADVGLAIDGVTHDGPADVAIQKYKDRMMTSRNRTSMIATGSAKDAAALRRSQSFAYGGMEPTSPPTASGNVAQSNGGRARIKSTYYTPGPYPRTSAAATQYGKHNTDHEHDGIHLEQHRIERADSRRGRDLTSALGLTSPIPPSPQPTLYPDDSMSVIGEVKKATLTGRSQKKPVPKASSHCDSPSASDAAALGSLMMVDFAGSKSTASLVNIRPCEAARAREGQGGTGTGKSNLKRRVEDKPPRVPSPPPIPSLAQMALEHADADYHSPTYSIYGLYDGDRKSRGVSYGY